MVVHVFIYLHRVLKGGLRALAQLQDSYNVPLYFGDLGHLMIGMFNIYHLRHESWRSDCTMNSFRQQTHKKDMIHA